MKNILIVIILFLTLTCNAQLNTLRPTLTRYLKTKNATVGFAALNLETGDTLTIHNAIHYPMQSVFKFHLALAVLDQVDKGKLTLDQKILITPKDVAHELYSPLREKYPAGNVQLSLSEIIGYTVSQSDNTGCDVLFRLLGGTAIVNDYIHQLGISEISIVANEEVMQGDWNVQFSNWTTPFATVRLLKKFYSENILSKTSSDFLWKTMVATTTGPMRIKGQLPTQTIVAHKTGFSGTRNGITAATNDIGIITLPNGQHLALAVFVSNSAEVNETNERIIADLSKVVWDYYQNKR